MARSRMWVIKFIGHFNCYIIYSEESKPQIKIRLANCLTATGKITVLNTFHDKKCWIKTYLLNSNFVLKIKHLGIQKHCLVKPRKNKNNCIIF